MKCLRCQRRDTTTWAEDGLCNICRKEKTGTNGIVIGIVIGFILAVPFVAIAFAVLT